MQQDYYSALARIVMASAPNDPQLRRTIYDLARQKLRRQIDWEVSEFSDTDGSERLMALEGAIEQIEADLARDIPQQTYFAGGTRAPVSKGTIEIIPPSQFELPPRQAGFDFKPYSSSSAPRSFAFRSTLPLIGAAVLGVVAYLAFEHEVRESPRPEAETQAIIPRNTSRSSPDMPMPGSYGVYAVTNGQLAELKPLPIKVPDRRVTVSAMIATKSMTKLPNGRAQFIVFKRDLVDNVPEKVVVRVVAHVVDGADLGGKHEAMTGAAGGVWAIRGIAYDMKVAPVSGNPAMIIIRPADADFYFPAGRYALVLKGVAYDFSVDGPVTDLAQCIVRTNQLGADDYTECRRP